MLLFRRFAKPITVITLTGFIALSLSPPPSEAALIGTDSVNSPVDARASVRATLEREDVRAALTARGVNVADVEARVNALSDSEAADLSGKLDQLPAGGDGLGLIVFVFLVLLITDILGFTDIFPFVKKQARR